MMRSLWIAASGMNGQQDNIDAISNNLSNVNTTAFKKVRPEFQDLIYLTARRSGTPATELTTEPVGIQVGHGVRRAATQRIFSQGSLKETQLVEDIAINGDGFFRVLLSDGSYGYTRDGSFKIDSKGQMVTSNGYRLLNDVIFPDKFEKDSINITDYGEVSVKVPGQGDEPIRIGQIQMHRFVNSAGLNAIGDNLFKETAGSGRVLSGLPGDPGMGTLLHKFLETSNVSTIDEMVNMIVAQRAYEMNSKAIQTSDTMMGIANSLKR